MIKVVNAMPKQRKRKQAEFKVFLAPRVIHFPKARKGRAGRAKWAEAQRWGANLAGWLNAHGIDEERARIESLIGDLQHVSSAHSRAPLPRELEAVEPKLARYAAPRVVSGISTAGHIIFRTTQPENSHISEGEWRAYEDVILLAEEGHIRNLLRCAGCGRWFVTKFPRGPRRRKHCTDCQKEARREYSKIYMRDYRNRDW